MRTRDDQLLVLDDDVTIADVLAHFLRERGYPVLVAHTGERALAILAETAIALLLLDLHLPDTHGEVLMEQVRQLDVPPEILVVTGHADLASAVHALDVGAEGYITKPIDLGRLGTLVDRILERRRLRRDNERLSLELAERLNESETLLAIASSVNSTLDPQEALRQICRELCRLLGADTGAVYLLDAASDHLVAFAGYHVPRDLLATFKATSLPLREQGFHAPLWHDRRPVFSDDVSADPRFTHELFRRFRHQSGLLLPLALDGDIVGAYYLVWWTERRQFAARELALVESVVGQVTMLFHNARLYDQARTRELETARLYEEARARQRRLGHIFDATSDGIMLLNPRGQVETANRRAGELLGFDPDRVTGTHLADLVGDFFSERAECLAAVAELRALQDDPERGAEGDLDLTEVKRVLHWVAAPTPGPAGRTLGFTLTVRDVTREREVSRMKTDFVAFVTHQLRTPLAGMKWMLELAAREEGLGADAASYVADARGAAERLIELVNDLLDVSRLEAGTLAVDTRVVDLADLTGAVLAELAPLMREKTHRATVAADPDASTVMADPQLLRQVLLNLVSNAVKFTPAGGEIDVDVARDGDEVRWSIRDTGIGIPAESQRRLFEKFYRARNARDVETEGTGLGLYIVRLIVERLGGRVWFESGEGHGTAFFVTLPARPPRAVLEAPAPKEADHG